MDSVEIRGLSCRCIIGIRARERRVEQRVCLDLKLGLDLERAGKSGRIAHTVDYARVSGELIALLKFRRYTLLEVAAEECAGWLFAAYPAILEIELGIAKPQALAGQADSGGVRILRSRPAQAAREATPFGFQVTQLETAEANIAILGVSAGATLSLGDLRAGRALIMPLSTQLEGRRPLPTLEPTLLGREGCANRTPVMAPVVVCAHRGPYA